MFPQFPAAHLPWFANANAITQSSWYPAGAPYEIPQVGEITRTRPS